MSAPRRIGEIALPATGGSRFSSTLPLLRYAIRAARGQPVGQIELAGAEEDSERRS
jgi:hypothetical protein